MVIFHGYVSHNQMVIYIYMIHLLLFLAIVFIYLVIVFIYMDIVEYGDRA